MTADRSFCDVCATGVASGDLPNMQWLHHFVAACHCGSFSAAAFDLGTTAATISSSVTKLEAAVGEKLFVRANGRGYTTPTTAGRLLLPTATKIIAMAAAIRAPRQ